MNYFTLRDFDQTEFFDDPQNDIGSFGISMDENGYVFVPDK